MNLLVILLPGLSFCSGVILGRYSGHRGAPILNLALMGIALAGAVALCFDLCVSGSVIEIYIADWFNLEWFNCGWRFLLDGVSGIMILLVLTISFLVHLYSISYMQQDPNLPRFLALLSLFTFFMIILVTSDSLIQMFVGWEGVGVVSYLLVNFWFTRASANRAALMALLTNRVGDWGYMYGLLLLILCLKTINLSVINLTFMGLTEFLQITILVALIVAVLGKSAQIGLHTWLPHAMEGPTPVSALLHAATLVTAGVYLLLRCAALISCCSEISSLLMIIGGATAFLGASLGLVAQDMKKVIAFSTCSQLGYMIYSIGLTSYTLALFHLVNHAFFKALLFLTAGGVIHCLADNQDLRKMGGLRRLSMFLYVMMLIGSISLMGLPFFTGFYSKETILMHGWNSGSAISLAGYLLCLISALVTTIYSIRTISTVFYTASNSSKAVVNTVSSQPLPITICLIILSILSIVWGYLSNNLMFYGPVSNWGQTPTLGLTNWGGGSAALALTILGSVVILFFYLTQPLLILKMCYTKTVIRLYNVLAARYYFDTLYNIVFVKKVLALGHITALELDKGFGEIAGPFGLQKSALILNLKVKPAFSISLTPIFYGQMLILGCFLLILVIALAF